MIFGSQQITDLIAQNINSGKTGWYNKVEHAIAEDCKKMIWTLDCSKYDREDIIQEVQLNVFKGLPEYIKKSGKYNEYQRNAWLKRIIEHEVSDYLKVKKKYTPEEIDDIIKRLSGGKNESDTLSTVIKNDTVKNAPEMLSEAISMLLAIRTTPDKIIAFLYNRVESIAKNRKNGSPGEVYKALKAKKLGEAFKKLTTFINKVMEVNMCDEDIEKFERILDTRNKDGVRYRDMVFNLSVKEITNSSNWIMDKMQNNKKKIEYFS